MAALAQVALSDVSIFKELIIASAIFTLGACATPPQKPASQSIGDYTHTRAYIGWLIEQEMSDADITGLSIALVDDKSTIWAQGFGYADKQANIRATPDTVYNVGSLSKVFTATAAMQLAEQSMLDIDRPLQKYLPGFSIRSRFGDTDNITPRNLMTHHSGLPCNWVQGMIVRHPGPFTEVVTAMKDEYTAYPADYLFSYSNLGIALLGAAIGEVAGSGYTGYMDTYLLGPLGMTHSRFASSTSSKSYDSGNEIEVMPMRDLPASGLNSSVSDIAHFMQMVLAAGEYNGRQIMKPESLVEMFKVQNADVQLDFDSKVGLGWMLNAVDVPHSGTVASHAGLTLNFHSLMAVLPEHKLGVVVMANSTTAQSVVSKVAAETLRLALEAKRGIVQPAMVITKASSELAAGGDSRAYEGYFDTLVGLVKVSGKPGDLHAEFMGQKFALIPHEDKEIGVLFKLFGFIPFKIDALDDVRISLHNIKGREVLALKSNGQSMLIGEKLTPVAIPEQMLDYVGDYEAVTQPDGPTFASVQVLHEDGYLIGAFTFPPKTSGFGFHPDYVFRVALKPVADNEVVMEGLGPGKDETMHLRKIGDETRISVSGLEFRKKPGKRS